MKSIKTEEKYWDGFYLENHKGKGFSMPSQFCVMCATEIDKHIPIVEFGCGNGRDSIFFARHDFRVLSMDLSEVAINQNIQKVKSHNLDNVDFFQGSVSNLLLIKDLINKARKYSVSGNLAVYSRFFLHSLDEGQEDVFLKTLSDVLVRGDICYIEFRDKEDEQIDKTYDNHYRKFSSLNNIIDKLSSKLGFIVEYSLSSRGVAKYREEDPIVNRIIFKKV
jgi:tellurite methyltransferase